MSTPEYRAAHREELAAKQRAWRRANPDYVKQYRADHANEILEAQRRRYAENKDDINAKRVARNGNRAEVRRAMLAATAEERRERRLARIAEWRRNHPEKVARYRRYNQTRRARLLGAFVERVDRFEVYDRAGGLCGICGTSAPRDEFDVDHILPLSCGGEHSYANTQPAHPGCNARKHNRVGALPAAA